MDEKDLKTKSKTTKADLEAENAALKAQLAGMNSAVPTATKGRVFKGTAKIHHDLFKLEVAKQVRNTSYIKGMFKPSEVEHIHFFHSYDSNGRKQDHCVQIGGHFHKMEYSIGADGIPFAKCVSGPLQWGTEINPLTGRPQRLAVPCSPIIKGKEMDTHTHETQYQYSEEIEKRTTSIEAAKIQTIDANKSTAPKGLLR